MTTGTARPLERQRVHDAPVGDPPEALPTGTVTFMLTDVEASTSLWQEHEDDAAVALARHFELLHAAVALHGGVRPGDQGEGDSIAAVFAKPSDALAAALDAQRALLAETWGSTVVRIRIGLHTGEANLRDERNYQGPVIARCARLRNLAHGGQTLLSNTTHELVADRLPDGVSFRDLGVHRLKGLDRPEQVWQLCHGDLADEFAALASTDALRSNLPAQLTTFVARDAGARAPRRADRSEPAGDPHGRRRLREDAPRPRSGGRPREPAVRRRACWVELAPVRDPARIAESVGQALGLRWEREDAPDVIGFIGRHLERRDTCLVLDNCEQVLEGAAALAEALLLAAPAIRIVATSREPLGVAGEVAWRVPSMDPALATALFLERAAQARGGYRPEPAEQETIARICERLDGIPLAIELAAARMRTTDPARIAAGLDDRFRLLTGGARTATPRQQTLEASVGWSHDLLDPDERIAFRRLSVFASGFTVEAAEGVVTGAAEGLERPIDRYAVLDLVSRLVDKSLVQLGDGTNRYSMLETIRQYARDRLVEAGEADTVREQHFAHFRSLAAQAAPELTRGGAVAWLTRLDGEHDNLQGALEWAESTAAGATDGRGDWDRLLALATDLTLFWELRGHLPLGRELVRARCSPPVASRR